MRNFEILRYIKKWRFLIVAICILGVFAVYKYAMSKQVYTAQAVIRYSNSEAKDGMTPSGDELDPNEIYSAKVITEVLEDLGIDVGVDTIRSRCQVTPIISDDEIARKEAVLKLGEEYEYNPTDYLVSFGVDTTYTSDFAANVLDSIIKNYFVNYGEKYINQTVLPNNASNIKNGEYDYIESAEILNNSVTEIEDYLNGKAYSYPDYRAASTGYAFKDLYNMYKQDLNYNIPELYSKILNQKISKDQTVLVRDYRNKISQDNIELTNLGERIDPLYSLITQYSEKSKQGIQYHYGKSTTEATDENGENNSDSSTDDYILKDVYDFYDGEEKVQIKTETTYDTLINQYVALEISRQYKQVDMQHRADLLTLFENAVPSGDATTEQQEIESEMNTLIDRLNTNYETVSETVDEFNQYLGASNITTLTSVNVSEKINVRLYMILAILLFLVCGCLGAILLGRIQDFIEYMLYTDRKTGLSNRTKCDTMINFYAEKPLPDAFTFILIRLDVLTSVNKQVGRKAGDALLAEFGRILRETASDYGFVGYNGSDQFMCMFEECGYGKAEMFINALQSYVEMYNAQNPEQNIVFSYAIEESTAKEIFDMRKLMAAAFREINSNNSATKTADTNTDTNKSDEK